MQGVPHHMINMLEPHEPISSFQFATMARKKIHVGPC